MCIESRGVRVWWHSVAVRDKQVRTRVGLWQHTLEANIAKTTYTPLRQISERRTTYPLKQKSELEAANYTYPWGEHRTVLRKLPLMYGSVLNTMNNQRGEFNFSTTSRILTTKQSGLDHRPPMNEHTDARMTISHRVFLCSS
jgi:hypothetical protein